jgi:hypothetical protein
VAIISAEIHGFVTKRKISPLFTAEVTTSSDLMPVIKMRDAEGWIRAIRLSNSEPIMSGML